MTDFTTTVNDGGMSLGSGVFTAPKAGIYAFTFMGLSDGYGSGYAGFGGVYIQHNSANVAMGYSKINGAASKTGAVVLVEATLNINMGDTIRIYHKEGSFGSNVNNHIQFTGSLIEENLVIS